jgi:hypothetical protein
MRMRMLLLGLAGLMPLSATAQTPLAQAPFAQAPFAQPPSAQPPSAQPHFAGDPQRNAAHAAEMQAIQRRDYRGALAIVANWMAGHPADIDFRHLEPVLHMMAGDMAGWEQSRTALLQAWTRMRGTVPPPADPGFTVDFMKAGQDLVVADQCYERAGRFGVLYRFTVISPAHQITSFFTVESSDSDNQLARELGRPPVFTLDHFRPGVHETVAMLPALPPYPELRKRVLAYLANPQPVSASRNNLAGLPNEGCAFNPP